MNSIEDRLDTLESVVDDQQAQIEAHKETIAAQQETIEAQRERLAAVENSDGVSMPISRRGALTAGGALGLLGLGAGTATAAGSGQVGTDSRPLRDLYSQTVNIGETSGDFTKIESNEAGDLLEFTLGVYPDTPLRLEKQGTTSGDYPNVIAGQNNEASKEEGNINGAAIGGGFSNTVRNDFGTIGGGEGNEANGEYATVAGGRDNVAVGDYSFAVGRKATAGAPGSFVVADATEDQFGVETSGAHFQMPIFAEQVSAEVVSAENGLSVGQLLITDSFGDDINSDPTEEAPDEFLQVEIDNNTYQIPLYNEGELK